MMVGGQTGRRDRRAGREVVSSTDVGLPLGPEGTAALLPAGVAEFGAGLSVSADEVRLFLALREAAHHRLFGARALAARPPARRGRGICPRASRWTRPRCGTPCRRSIRPTRKRCNEALSGAALFQPEDTPQQKAALARLETALALVEGWVATVVDEAAGNRLPQANALAEAIRRRRATGGPAERTFATLVGLELRPRRLREAAPIWRGLTDAARHHRAGRRMGAPGPAARPRRTSTTRMASSAGGRSWDISALEEATGAAGDEGAADEEPPAGGDEPEGGPADEPPGGTGG